MLSLIVALGLAASEVPATERPVALLEGAFAHSELDASQIKLWNDVLFTELSGFGVRVRNSSDIASVLGLERQRELMGCSEASSGCGTEIAQALNADGLIVGSAGHTGNKVVLTVRVLSATGQLLATESLLTTGADQVVDSLHGLAERLAEKLRPTFGSRIRLPTPPATAPSAGTRRWWWVPALGVAVAAAVGVTGQVVARQQVDSVRTGDGVSTLVAADRRLSSARSWEVASDIAFGVAAAAAVSAVALGLFGSAGSPVALRLSVSPSGMALWGEW